MMSKREEEVLQVLNKTISSGSKPTAQSVARELGWKKQDVHRCLNILEKKGEIVSYSKNVLGFEKRMIGVKRR